MGNQMTTVQKDETPWSAMVTAIKAALSGKPHPGQNKTVTIGNEVSVNDPLGGSAHAGYKITVTNNTEHAPQRNGR